MNKLLSLTTLLILTFCMGCVSSTTVAEKDSDTEKVVVTEEAVRLAQTDISNKELGEKLVCTYETKVGSRFKQKVCRTKLQVDQEREHAQDEMDRIIKARPITSN